MSQAGHRVKTAEKLPKRGHAAQGLRGKVVRSSRSLPDLAERLLDDGACTCGRPDCDKSRGKHPLLEDWQTAPLNIDALVDALDCNPHYNIGLRTGRQPCGRFLAVVDVDGLLELLDEYSPDEPFPLTLMARTGSGGTRLFYWLPDGKEMGNRAGLLGKRPKDHGRLYEYPCESWDDLPALPEPEAKGAIKEAVPADEMERRVIDFVRSNPGAVTSKTGFRKHVTGKANDVDSAAERLIARDAIVKGPAPKRGFILSRIGSGVRPSTCAAAPFGGATRSRTHMIQHYSCLLLVAPLVRPGGRQSRIDRAAGTAANRALVALSARALPEKYRQHPRDSRLDAAGGFAPPDCQNPCS